METIHVNVKRIHPRAKLPKFAHVTDACADLHAVEDITIPPHETRLVSTGIVLELPPNCEGQVRPRSGLALKHQMIILNSPGTIDAEYRGEVKVILHNLSSHEFRVQTGDRIAQLAVRPVPSVIFEEQGEISSTTRGEGGFGSTGINTTDP